MDDSSTSGGERRLALAVCYRDGVSPRSGSQLLQNVSDVCLDGHLADEELLSYLAITKALRDERQNVFLSGSEQGVFREAGGDTLREHGSRDLQVASGGYDRNESRMTLRCTGRFK